LLFKVLQEMAAARHVLIMCGSAEIDGHVFCLGLDSLGTNFEDAVLQVTFLIGGAIFRPRNISQYHGKLSPAICPLGELVDKYHAHKATQRHDKIYALLGMCSDDLSKADLEPNYSLPWSILMQRLVKFLLGNHVSVLTWTDKEAAVIKAKGCVLGKVSKVEINVGLGGGQALEASFENTSKELGYIRYGIARWTLPISAKLIQSGDLICLFEGSSKPTIVRLRDDHFAIVMIAAILPEHIQTKEGDLECPNDVIPPSLFIRDFPLVWNWEISSERFRDPRKYDIFMETNNLSDDAETGLEAQLSNASKTWNIALILGDLGEHEKAEKMLRVAMEGYQRILGKEYGFGLECQYGLTPLSWAAGNGCHAVLHPLLSQHDVDIDLKDSQYGRTPLSWAGQNGHDDIVKQLLTAKAEIDVKDKHDRTPLSLASENGHTAVIKLLLETDNVDADSKDNQNERTPLSWAAQNGYAAVVQLLLETGKVEIDAKDKYGRTPLLWAAQNGHDTVIKLLLETGNVDADSKDNQNERTPLSWAAQNGHDAVIKLLLETGKGDSDAKDKYGRTPLSWAAENGHDAAIKLLLVTGKADINSKDDMGQTSLCYAAKKGQKSVVEVLLNTANVDISSKDKNGHTPLSYATAGGHNAVIQLLEDWKDGIYIQSQQNPENQVSAAGTETPWDERSDISEISSVFSLLSVVESESSLGSTRDISQKAWEHLVSVLANDAELNSLYENALVGLDHDKFLRNHNRLLKIFFHELSLETQQSVQLRTIQALNRRSQRARISDLIRKLFDPSRSESKHIMNSFNEQGPDRQYTLDRYLAAQASELEMPSGSNLRATTASHSPVESNSEAGFMDDERESSDDDQVDNPTFHQLDLVTEFLTKGAAFDRFRAGLRRFIHPPTTLKEAMSYCDPEYLSNFLTKRFDTIAESEYPWLRELEDVGYSRNEMAALLLEHAKDTPWIYFEPGNYQNFGITEGFHLQRCVHWTHSSECPTLAALPGILEPSDEQDVQRSIQELCGLAGVTPVSPNREEWNGTVRFKDDNSTAIVSYTVSMSNGHLGISKDLLRVKKALDNFCTAASVVQAKGLCCDSFTVLTKSQNSSNESLTNVELWRLELKLAVELTAELDRLLLLDQVTAPEVCKSRAIADQILEPLAPVVLKDAVVENIDRVIHSCSLAVQFLCLGFLSYIQAHIGPIQPFFLDSPQRKVLLLGNQMSDTRTDVIIAELINLTCVAGMTQGPVFAFSTNHGLSIPERKYDLVASAEDLLDTWGPGRFIYRGNETENPCAIIIGDGFIYTNDPVGKLFHWSPSASLQDQFSVSFDSRTKIMIGALIKVNEECYIDEKKCWLNSCSALLPLGPSSDHWEAAERQGGVQAGQYFVGQFNQTWRKVKGRSLKDYQLEQEDDLLLPLLDAMWGLQVSFCTSVARRVPLRELVADMLPIFANTLFCQPNLWEDLRINHNIVDAFKKPGLREWLQKLSTEQQSFVLRLIRRILTTLQPSGVDRKGKNLKIAWPQEGDVQRGFVIPCENQSFWARLVADSEDCATFAYISPNCLESELIKCSGPSPVWQNSSILLETAVIHHQAVPSHAPRTLEHKKWYFVKKLDTVYLVKVHKPEGTASARLIASPSPMPQAFQHRMFWREEWKNNCRLRERQSLNEPAELVFVLASKSFPLED
jgi:ankyrin repeat protein